MYTTIKTVQRNFVTDPDRWSGQSLYFNSLFSGKWGDKQEDGSYFVETDAHIFEHILRYLRTRVLPVFYDREKGHDFALYQAVLEEAKYFQIDRLVKWIGERKYLEAVQVNILATESQDRRTYKKHTRSDLDRRTFMVEDRYVEMTTSGNMETTMIPMAHRRSVFYCPNGKHGKSTKENCSGCTKQASDGKVNVNGGWRGEDQMSWCIVRKEVVFDHDLCVNAYSDDAQP
ncbi:POZ [Glarea lozoyensis ATCC 20868]|uniref:POZ n=1 Tax=Glarea lozoyensis (strain ATCC 20868 / MF5171) TaxID=1116229 RepID=S3DML8_GLAL2|nr:POZ [Glarea lozoyensis ATCC 20868]EPE33311.1 POZ [Glarea lozoyensis ATCC 20868]